VQALLAALTIIAFGDSLTAADWMQHTPYAYENHGVNGDQSWKAAELAGENQSYRRFRDWLDSYTVVGDETVVLFYGTNDVRYPTSGPVAGQEWAGDGLFNNFRRTRIATGDSLEQMADDALGAGMAVLIVVPPPIIEAPTKHTADEAARFNTNIRAMQADIARIVADRPGEPISSVSLYDHFTGLSHWPDTCLYEFTGGGYDGIHPGGQPCPADGLSGQEHMAIAIEGAL